MNRNTILYVLLFTCALRPAIARAQSDPIADEVQRILDDARGRYGLKGLAASVVTPGHAIRSFSSGVIRAGEPIDTSRSFYFASFTKLLTAIVVMQLVDEGKMSLDDTVGDFIDPLPNVDASTTVRELLQHRSTLGEYFSGALLEASTAPDSVFDDRQVLVDYMPAPVNPGHGYNYINSNFQVLGLIVEAVTGRDGTDEFEDRLFGPVTEGSAKLAPIGLPPSEVNGGWYNFGGGWVDVGNVSSTSALTAGKYCTGVVGTTADMLRVLKALFDGAYVSQGSLDQMKTGSPVNFFYGLGMMRRSIDGEPVFGHGGSLVHHSRTFYNPERGVGLSLAINQESGQTETIFQDLYRAIRDIATGVEGDVPTEATLSLAGWPNPTSGPTLIVMSLDRPGPVQVAVYNILGQEVETLATGYRNAGQHELAWDAGRLAAGLYLVRLRTSEGSTSLNVLRSR